MAVTPWNPNATVLREASDILVTLKVRFQNVKIMQTYFMVRISLFNLRYFSFLNTRRCERLAMFVCSLSAENEANNSPCLTLSPKKQEKSDNMNVSATPTRICFGNDNAHA